MFRLACSLTALVCAVLFLVFLVVPGQYIAGYGVLADTSGVFLGRRVSPMFLGLGIMLWMVRDQFDPVVQRAVCWSMIAVFAGIALTGLWAFASGLAGQTILLAAAGELVIAGAFFWAINRS